MQLAQEKNPMAQDGRKSPQWLCRESYCQHCNVSRAMKFQSLSQESFLKPSRDGKATFDLWRNTEQDSLKQQKPALNIPFNRATMYKHSCIIWIINH